MKLYGLIGYPLGHSFSKTYFNDKFKTEGLEDCSFELFPLQSIDAFRELIQSNPNLQGLAVTIPYKQTVMPFLHSITKAAADIGAVNCIKMESGKLTGYNTDVTGFEQSFISLLQPHHKKALVLGTGGASKAVKYVLDKLNIPFLLVSRRADLNKGIITYNDLNEQLMKEYRVIINCSPVGTYPNEGEKPAIPYEFISRNHYLYDLVYKPAETLFLTEGKNKGAVVKNGYEMLILQAEENWKIWNEK